MLGVLGGSLVGTYVLARAHVRVLRYVFSVVIGVLAFEMMYNGFSGRYLRCAATDPNELDKPVELIVGTLLRTGVALAALVVFCGGIYFSCVTARLRRTTGLSMANPTRCAIFPEYFTKRSRCIPAA